MADQPVLFPELAVEDLGAWAEDSADHQAMVLVEPPVWVVVEVLAVLVEAEVEPVPSAMKTHRHQEALVAHRLELRKAIQAKSIHWKQHFEIQHWRQSSWLA